MPLVKRTLTPALLAANRQNAKKSTGPRTPEGKRRVSWNGLKHGRASRSFREAIALLGEDPEAYDRSLEFQLRLLSPQTPAGHRRVENIVKEFWLWDRRVIWQDKGPLEAASPVAEYYTRQDPRENLLMWVQAERRQRLRQRQAAQAWAASRARRSRAGGANT